MGTLKLNEVKKTLDQLLIENALKSARLKSLTSAFFELAFHLLEKDELSNLKSWYHHTLRNDSIAQVDQLGKFEIPYALLVREKFEIESYYNSMMDLLEENDS